MSLSMRPWIFLVVLSVIKVSQCKTTHGRATRSSMTVGIGTYERFLDECDVLLQVDKPESSIKMAQAMKNENISEAWIPIRKQSFAHLTWLDGTVYDYETHSGIEHYDCGILHVNNQFLVDTRICHQILPHFICETGGNTSCSNQNATCVALKGKTFAVFERKRTWYTARDDCKREGYQLASISNHFMNPLLAKLHSRSIEFAWIGLRKAEFVILSHSEKRHLVWRSLVNSNWDIQQPNTCHKCSCTLASFDDTFSLKWSTRKCNVELPFTCGWNTKSTMHGIETEDNDGHYMLALCVTNIVTVILLLVSWIYFWRLSNQKDKKISNQEEVPLMSNVQRDDEEDDSDWNVDLETLEKVRDYMAKIMKDKKQRGENSRIMLSTYIKHKPTRGNLGQGQFLSLVWCDMNRFSQSVIDISKDKELTTIEEGRISLRDKVVQTETNGKLFDIIAEAATNFIRNYRSNIKGIGFTCALPCRHNSLNSAVINEFRKDIFLPEESIKIGSNVAKELKDGIIRQVKSHGDKRNPLQCSAVISDTSECFMSCSYLEAECIAAVVLDTGTNACFWKEQESELINTEWGAFGDDDATSVIQGIRNPLDKELDQASSNKTKAIFEKMVSGMYISELCHRQILKDLCKGENAKKKWMNLSDIEMIVRGDDDAGHVVKQYFPNEPLTEDDLDRIRKVCKMILRRSANLAAAGITAVLKQYEKKKSVTVAMAGRLWSIKMYEEKIRNTVEKMRPKTIKVRFVSTDPLDGKGAALVASIVTNKEKERLQTLK